MARDYIYVDGKPAEVPKACPDCGKPLVRVGRTVRQAALCSGRMAATPTCEWFSLVAHGTAMTANS